MAAHRGSHYQSMELLAASAMNAFAPGPGRYSFTTKFMDVLRTALLREGNIDTRTLHSQLARARPPIQATPVLFDIAESKNPSIVLHPLPGSPLLGPEPHTELFLVLSIHHPLDRNKMVSETKEWLERCRDSAPKGVGSVKIVGMKKLPRAQWRSAVRGIIAVGRIKTSAFLRSGRPFRGFYFNKISHTAYQLFVIPVRTERYLAFLQFSIYALFISMIFMSLSGFTSCLFWVDCRDWGTSITSIFQEKSRRFL
jgi:hypothetical protein